MSAPLWRTPSGDKSLDVLGIGECSLDRVGIVEALPTAGSKAVLSDYDERPGGQVATAMLGCARLGLACAYAGAVGDDADAERVLAPLRDAGVDLAAVQRRRDTRTRLAMILVERASGQRTVLARRDARLALRVEELDRSVIARSRVLELDLTEPDVARWAARVARRAGTAVVLDADEASSDLEALLPDVDFPIVSEGFAETLGEGETSRDALTRLGVHGARLAVVTQGDQGAVGRFGDRWIESPAFAVPVRDTTGAGDAFRAGFIWALLQGYGPDATLRAANAAAGLNCRALGAQDGLPTATELRSMPGVGDDPEIAPAKLAARAPVGR